MLARLVGWSRAQQRRIYTIELVSVQASVAAIKLAEELGKSANVSGEKLCQLGMAQPLSKHQTLAYMYKSAFP